MDWLDYREKLGIGFNDSEKTSHFIIKIFNILDDLTYEMDDQVGEDEYYAFCNMTGTPMDHGALYGEGYRKVVSVLRKHNKNFLEFIAHYIAFINCQKDESHKQWTKENFKNALCNLLDEAHIPYDLLKDKNDYFLFPKGVEEFDASLVSDTLLWLKDYPLTQKAWTNALKSYSEATDETASETADKFRKTLERFFQEFFGSEKSLENLMSEYGTFLSSKGVPSELSNDLKKLLDSYTKYNNNYAKHHDKTSKCVLEYIMYQTGNLMRLMLTLK